MRTQVRQERLDNLESLTLLATAYVLLLTGGIVFDPRLHVLGVPLDLVIAITAIALLLLCSTPAVLSRILVLLLPFLVLAPSMFWMQREAYGATKYFNFVLTSGLCGGLIFLAAKRTNVRFAGRVWVFLSLILLCGALVYKLKNGFLDRETRFLLNGPIVFGRIMGIAVVVSAFVFQGRTRVALGLIFFCAVLWTASKGPVLALFFVGTVGMVLAGRWRPATLLLTTFLVVLVLSARLGDRLGNVPVVGRQLQGISIILNLIDSSGSTSANEGSIGSRQAMWAASMDLIARRPVGVGMGDWATTVHRGAFEYPHNIVLEILSESGIPLTILAVVFALYVYSAKFDWLGASCIYLLAAQQVSGDLLDFRFFGAYLLAGALLAHEGRTSTNLRPLPTAP